MYNVIIIGSGFSGIAAAISLQKKNISNYIILERDAELGGTWWKNSYPGAAVDVPSRLYSFSFYQYNWSRLFAKQKEILNYTQSIIKDYQLKEKSKTNCSIQSLKFDEEKGIWTVFFNDKTSIQSQFIINCTGGLSQEAIPNIKGLSNFQNEYFHTSKWNHDFDYTNKTIAVIGTGASGIQVIPEIAKKAKKVHVLQRTPHWIIPRPDRKLKNWERKLLQKPFFNQIFRLATYLKLESRVLFFSKFPSLAKIVKLEALSHIKKQIKDPELRKKVIPIYDIGCKRVLLSNSYYPSLERENVTLETSPIEEIHAKSIQLTDKTLENIDLIVFATGFHASENAIPFEIIGKNKIAIKNYWKDGAHAYYGISVPNFPNLFMAMGPNTGTGHTSVIYFIESQMQYIIDAIDKGLKQKWKSIEIKEEVETKFNQKIQKQLGKTIWSKGGCHSWYLTKTGKNTTLYPDFSFVYRKNTKSFNENIHHIVS